MLDFPALPNPENIALFLSFLASNNFGLSCARKKKLNAHVVDKNYVIGKRKMLEELEIVSSMKIFSCTLLDNHVGMRYNSSVYKSHSFKKVVLLLLGND